MATNPAALLPHLRRLASQHHTDAAPDPALLERFVRSRDEGAFAALVARHGPLVLRVCRRMLADPHAAEDAFQATFLVLARRAAAIRRRQRLAGWLHGVAYRVALKTRTVEALRQGREAPSADLAAPDPRPDPLAELTARELLSVLDDEVQRLPEVYRLPVLLCCLEGHTQEETARLLGWTAGSVRGRLERGRARLRDRLARRGLTLPAALAVMGIGQGAASAGLPAALAGATVRAALAFTAAGGAPAGAISARVAALAEGGLKSMAAVKLKIGAALLLLTGVLVGGAGLAAYQVQTTNPPADQGQAVSRPGTREAGQPKPEADKLPRTDWQAHPLPEGVLARMGSGRLRHGGHDLIVMFAPDGKTLLSIGNDDLRVWDAVTGKLVWRIALEIKWPSAYCGRPLLYDLSATAITVASIDHKTWTLTCQVVDIATGQTRKRIELKVPDFKFPDQAGLFAMSPGSKRIAVSDKSRGALLLYDPSTGQETLRLPVPAGWVEAAAFAPDAKTIALCSRIDTANTVRVHDVTSGQVVKEFKWRGDSVSDMAFTPDGRSLVSINYHFPNFPKKGIGDATDRVSATVSIWDLTTGQERHRLNTEPGAWYGTLAFSPDSRFLATGSFGPHVIQWDLATGKEVHRLRSSLSYHFAFSPNGKVLATSSGGAISLWDVATGQRLPVSAEPGAGVSWIRFSRDGQRLLGFAGVPIAWEAATGREVRRFADVPNFEGCPVLSPDESLIAAGKDDGPLRLHDATTGKEVRVLQGHEELFSRTIQFAPDGRRLYSSGSDGTIRVWNLTNGWELKLTTNEKELSSAALAASPDGRWLASYSRKIDPESDHPFLIWDLTTSRQVHRLMLRFTSRHSSLASLAFSPDSRLVAATSEEHRQGENGQWESYYDLQVWEAATGKELTGFVNGKTKGLGPAVAFSPDGRMLATGSWDGTVLLWELATRRQRWQVKGHEDGLACLDGITFSPDGRALAVASKEAPVYLWDVLGRLEQQPPPTPAELEQAWADLRSTDATAAFRIVRRLINAPEQVVPFLRKQVQPAAPVEAKRLARLIADLDSDRFEVRQQATAELAELGEQAEPALRKALAGQPTLEARQRLEQLVEKLAGPVTSLDRLRALRAMETLEYIGTLEARQVLEGLTKGVPEARLTREAKAALERLAKQPTAGR